MPFAVSTVDVLSSWLRSPDVSATLSWRVWDTLVNEKFLVRAPPLLRHARSNCAITHA